MRVILFDPGLNLQGCWSLNWNTENDCCQLSVNALVVNSGRRNILISCQELRSEFEERNMTRNSGLNLRSKIVYRFWLTEGIIPG